MLLRSGKTRHNAQPSWPGTANNVVRARRVSDNNVSKGAFPSIVGEEKVHAPVSSIHAAARQEVTQLAANTEVGLCCNGGHGVANSVVRGGGAAAVRTTEEMDPERVKRPAALAGRVHSHAKLRQARARAQCDREQVADELKRSDDRRRHELSPPPPVLPQSANGHGPHQRRHP